MEAVPEQSVTPQDPGLAMALEQLPQRLRLPLVMHYAEGMSYAEIAQALRLPQSTIRSRLHKGREELRKELEAE